MPRLPTRVRTLVALTALMPATLLAETPGEQVTELDRAALKELIQDERLPIVLVSLAEQNPDIATPGRFIHFDEAWQDRTLGNDVRGRVATVVFYDPANDPEKRTEAIRAFEKSGFDDAEYHVITDRSVLATSADAFGHRSRRLGDEAVRIHQKRLAGMLRDDDLRLVLVSLADGDGVEVPDLQEPGKAAADTASGRSGRADAGEQGTSTSASKGKGQQGDNGQQSGSDAASDADKANKTDSNQTVDFAQAWGDQDLSDDVEEDVDTVVFIDPQNDPAQRGEAMDAFLGSGYDDINYFFITGTGKLDRSAPGPDLEDVEVGEEE